MDAPSPKSRERPSIQTPPPKSSSRYAVFRELASGGMASVFYARLMGPSGFTRTVAVKRPHPQLATDGDFARMFIDEARVASRIHHPNVVSTLDVIEAPNELGLVMEYVHGEALSRLWSAARRRGERIPVPIAAAILLDILHGLHAAHEATDQTGQPLDIVHRDVSPQNVLVGADGITRIVDFGIAKAAGRLHTTRDGAVKGKYAYMAPEQLRGEKVDRRTDIYAASIVFWELLTGDGLFRGANEGEEIYKSMEAVVPAPSTVDEEVPRAFDSIVLQGLDRNPERRFETARAMAIEIERAAPAIRPSEVAAWVEHLAGEALSGRAAIIAEMEGSGRDVTALGADEPATTPSGPSSRQVDLESQVSHAGVVAEQSSASLAARPRMSRRLVGVSLLVLLGAGTYGARTLVHGSASQSATDAGPSSAGPASSLAATEPAAAPAASGVPKAAAAVDASVPATPTPKSPGRSRHPADRGSCDPPYIVDSAGREIFKLQCL